MDRRSVLAAAGALTAGGFVGCLDQFQSGQPPSADYPLELTVQNDHDRSYDVQTVVTTVGGNDVFDRSFTLGPGEGRGVSEEFTAGRYTIRVTLDDRSESRSYWNTELCDRYRVRTAIARDGHVTHSSACQAAGADPPPIGGEPPPDPS